MADEPTQQPAAPKPRKPRKAKPKSRSTRWADACSDANFAMDNLDAALADLQTALAELKDVQEEYQGWRDNLPENLANSALGGKLDDVTGLDIENLADEIETAISTARDNIGEAEALDLPRGFGRD